MPISRKPIPPSRLAHQQPGPSTAPYRAAIQETNLSQGHLLDEWPTLGQPTDQHQPSGDLQRPAKRHRQGASTTQWALRQNTKSSKQSLSSVMTSDCITPMQARLDPMDRVNNSRRSGQSAEQDGVLKHPRPLTPQWQQIGHQLDAEIDSDDDTGSAFNPTWTYADQCQREILEFEIQFEDELAQEAHIPLRHERDEIKRAPNATLNATAVRPPLATPVLSTTHPADELTLMTLGYTPDQAMAIRPSHQSAVIEHHQALSELGCRHDQIVKIGQNREALQFLTRENCQNFRGLLKHIHLKDVAHIASHDAGELALETLLQTADDLKTGPLQLSAEELAQITQQGKRPTLLAVQAVGHELLAKPYSLSKQQVVDIANRRGNSQSLMAVKELLPELINPSGPYQLTHAQVLGIVTNGNANPNLRAVKELLPELINPSGPYQLTLAQVLGIVTNGNVNPNLRAVKELLPELINPTGTYQLTRAEVVGIATGPNGALALRAVKELVPDLIKHTTADAHEFIRAEVLKISRSKYRTNQNLRAALNNLKNSNL